MKSSHIQFDSEKRDFIINGRPLLAHLAKHEGINASMYQSALGVQPNAVARLRGEAAPDLAGGHVALYVCGMCGDYDGAPIGVRVGVNDLTIISWDEMGCNGFDEWHQFSKVRSYKFDRAEYLSALHSANAT